MIDTAIIIAGGEGKRMQESGIATLKPLVIVNGKPLICYIIDSLIACNIKNIIIIEPWNRSIRQKIKNIYADKKLIFINALKEKKMFYNLMLVRKYIQNRFILADADIIVTPQVMQEFINNDQDCFGTIAIVKKPTIQNNHYLQIENDKIKAFDKQAKKGFHGGFLYTFDPEFISYVEESIVQDDLSFTSLVTNLAKQVDILPNYVDNIWDVDCYEDIVKTEQLLQKTRAI
jgi:glucose-1-phosphate thymidylyltransferase